MQPESEAIFLPAFPNNMTPTLQFPPTPQYAHGGQGNPPFDWSILDLSVVDDIVLQTIVDLTIPYPPCPDPGQAHPYPDLPPQ